MKKIMKLSISEKFYFIMKIVPVILIIIWTFGSLAEPYISAASTEKVIVQTTTKAVASKSTTKATSAKAAKKLNNKAITYPNVKYKKFYDITKSTTYIKNLNSKITTINKALKTSDYTESARKAMTAEVARLKKIKTKVNNDIKLYKTWENEYYHAAKTWEYFKQRGFSDAVVSGIIGNMMIETSGGSLKLKPTIYNPSRKYYGLCQWSLKYRPEVAGMSFEKQLAYLYSDMKTEFDTFGKCYRKGFTYNNFLKMTDPEEAALAFAKAYERCGSGSYSRREQAALKAYNYFI